MPRYPTDTGQDSFAITEPTDIPSTRGWRAVLNDAVRRTAAATGARYVDTYTPSAGHDACTPVGTRWLEPLVAPINAYPVHPNATGEAVMDQDTLVAIGR